MSTDPQPARPNPFPLPEGIKLRARKFGTKPFSDFVSASVGPNQSGVTAPQSEFTLRWEDAKQGLTVLVREREDGHVIAGVFCTDASLLNKAAVSVGLLGKLEPRPARKTIPLNVPESNGCSGSADFGPLADLVKELGPQLAVLVFLLL